MAHLGGLWQARRTRREDEIKWIRGGNALPRCGRDRRIRACSDQLCKVLVSAGGRNIVLIPFPNWNLEILYSIERAQ